MMNNNQDIKDTIYREGEEYTITPDTASQNPDIDWLIERYDCDYSDFVELLKIRLNHSELRKHRTTTWEGHSITKPIYKLISDNYTKHVDIRIMYYNLIQFLRHQLEKLQAEYCAINSQGKNKERSFIIKMKNKVVAIMTTYIALEDALGDMFPVIGQNIPEVEQSIINANKLIENLMQFLKGEKQ